MQAQDIFIKHLFCLSSYYIMSHAAPIAQGCRAVSGETYSVEKAERGIALELAPTSRGGNGRTLAPMEALQRELRAQARCPRSACCNMRSLLAACLRTCLPADVLPASLADYLWTLI